MFFTGDATDPFTLREATDKIMRAIGQMSGQEYVDIYASRAKEILREDEEE
jgi:1-acyl-sn-glycerol-3-phosphate acyltransferase